MMWAPTAGATLEWFRNNFCNGDSYEVLNKLAEESAEGSEGLICIPHLCGTIMPENDSNIKGVFFGITLKHGKGDFIRAIMESVSYVIKEFLDYIGADVMEIRSLGGGAKSSLWCRIKSAVTQKKVLTLKENETACLGSAIFAGMGSGAYADSAAAADKAVETDFIYEMDSRNYIKLYNEYREKEKRIKEIYGS